MLLALAITLFAPLVVHIGNAVLEKDYPALGCPATVEEWAARGVVTYRCIDAEASTGLRCSLQRRICERETRTAAVVEVAWKSIVLLVVLLLAGEYLARRPSVT